MEFVNFMKYSILLKNSYILLFQPAMELCKYPQVLGFVENASHRSAPHEW